MEDEMDEVDVENDFEHKSTVFEGPVSSNGPGVLSAEWDHQLWNIDQSWQLESEWPIIDKGMDVFAGDWQGETSSSVTQNSKTPAVGRKVVWSDEEKATFLSAFDAYPKMWSKIAVLIPTKTLQQVRAYGRKYVSEKSEEVASSPRKKSPLKKKQNASQPITNPSTTVQERLTGEVVNITRGTDSSSESDVDIEDCDEISPANLGDVDALSPMPDHEGHQNPNSQSKHVLNSSNEGNYVSSDKAVSSHSDDSYVSERMLHQKFPLLDGGAEERANDKLQDSESTSILEESSKDEAKIDETDFYETTDENILAEGDPASEDVLQCSAWTVQLPNQSSQNDKKHNPDEHISSDITEEEEEVHLNEYPVLSSKGDIIYLPNPTKELQKDRHSITDEERCIHSEFFDGKSNVKNEARYLKIRNYIIDSWIKCRPEHLNKTSIRTGLKSCGDVNCIGRIHRYLEQIGAINFGCDKAQYNQALPKSSTCSSQPKQQEEKPFFRESSGLRKRRVRDEEGQWVPPEELEGKTIHHPELTQDPIEKKSRKVQDPFKLIPCETFSETQRPYMMTIEGLALLLMDVHSQLSHTEVAGLLGGAYTTCSQGARLVVMSAVPCQTDSTLVQCDIDPVSQLKACEKIAAYNQCVVGWYHSHPTFDPNPSLRDLDTQFKYQEWYGQDGSPYVGVIVSPWLGRSRPSSINCLTVNSHQPENSIAIKAGAPPQAVPYMLEWQASWEGWTDEQDYLDKVSSLVTHCASQPHKVALSNQQSGWGAIGCMNKVLEAADRWLPAFMDSSKKHKMKTSLQFLLTDIYSENINELVESPS